MANKTKQAKGNKARSRVQQAVNNTFGSIVVRENRDTLEIRLPWASNQSTWLMAQITFVVLFFTVAGFYIFGALVYGLATDAVSWRISLVQVILLGPLFALALFFCYLMLTHWVNETVVTVNRDVVTVRNVPLPLLGSEQIPVTDLDQIVVENPTSDTDEPQAKRSGYRVYANLKDGTQKTVFKFAENPEVASRLEQRIEDYLGITS